MPRDERLALREAAQPIFQLPTNKGGEGGVEALPGKLEVAEGLPRDVPRVHVENLAVGSLIIPPREKDMPIYLREGIVEGGKGVSDFLACARGRSPRGSDINKDFLNIGLGGGVDAELGFLIGLGKGGPRHEVYPLTDKDGNLFRVQLLEEGDLKLYGGAGEVLIPGLAFTPNKLSDVDITGVPIK